MRVVVTGGAGFIGRAVIERLLAKGDTVVALVRDPAGAAFLEGPRVTLERSDLASTDALRGALAGADAVAHIAGSYRVGIRAEEHAAMWDANVGTTERVLDAAIATAVPRVLYVSTLNVLGNTHGRVVDEAHRREPADGFLSWYDETKVRAHEVALERIARGAPIVIGMPSQAYGPHDHSITSRQLEDAYAGRLRSISFADAGLAWVHVEDLAGGLVAVLERGRIGEAYSLGGECRRLGEAIAIAAAAAGRRPPWMRVPTGLLRAIAPLNDRLGGLPGAPANLREILATSDGVTFWANHAKAAAELGFAPRPLARGIRDTWGGDAS